MAFHPLQASTEKNQEKIYFGKIYWGCHGNEIRKADCCETKKVRGAYDKFPNFLRMGI